LKKPLAIVTLSVMLSACASLRQPSETESAPTAADKAAANTKKAPANARSKSLLKAKVQHLGTLRRLDSSRQHFLIAIIR